MMRLTRHCTPTFFKLLQVMPGFKLSKQIPNTTLCNATTNSSKTESKLSSLLKYMFPALLEVNSLPATIQKFTHLCDIPTTWKLKKNRQEQTQLLKREKARLSSVALISIHCFSEEIFISKDQAGQESNQTQTHTHTHMQGKVAISLSTAGWRRSFDVARPDWESTKHTHTGLVSGKQHRGEGTHTHRAPLACPERMICSCMLKYRFLRVCVGRRVCACGFQNHIGPSCPGLRSIL